MNPDETSQSAFDDAIENILPPRERRIFRQKADDHPSKYRIVARHTGEIYAIHTKTEQEIQLRDTTRDDEPTHPNATTSSAYAEPTPEHP